MHSRALQIFVLLAASACSRGEVTSPDTAPPDKSAGRGGLSTAPAPRHEQVMFTWESLDESLSGRLQATLPTGEVFTGDYHEITTNIPAGQVDDFYGLWYTGPWGGDVWNWDGAWPYYDSVEGYILHYTGKIVGKLKGDRGTEMRCQFRFDDPEAGIKGGGSGDCQVSNGERITAKFAPS